MIADSWIFINIENSEIHSGRMIFQLNRCTAEISLLTIALSTLCFRDRRFIKGEMAIHLLRNLYNAHTNYHVIFRTSLLLCILKKDIRTHDL